MSQDKEWVAQPKSEGGEGGKFNPVWNPQEVPTIEGVLIESKPNVGKWNHTVYEVKTGDGTIYSVWGTKLLSKQLDPLSPNSYIKIQYLGKKQGKNNAYHDYDVFVLTGEAPASVNEAPAPAAAPAPAVAPAPDIATTDPALGAEVPEVPEGAAIPVAVMPETETKIGDEQNDNVPF